MGPQQSHLDSDFQVFEGHRKQWFEEHGDKYVVIHDGKVLGFFEDYSEALKSAVAELGVASQFLIQQVCLEEPVFVIY